MRRNKAFVGKKRVQFTIDSFSEVSHRVNYHIIFSIDSPCRWIVVSQLNAYSVTNSQPSNLSTSSSQCTLSDYNDDPQYALERQPAHQPQVRQAKDESEDHMSIVSDMSVTAFLTVLHQIEVDMVKQLGQGLIPSWLVGWMRWVKNVSQSQSQSQTQAQSQSQSRCYDKVNFEEEEEEAFSMGCFSSFEDGCLSPGLELQVA